MNTHKHISALLIISLLVSGCMGPLKPDSSGVQIPENASEEVVEEVKENQEHDFSTWKMMNESLPANTLVLATNMNADTKNNIQTMVQNILKGMPEDIQEEVMMELEIMDIEHVSDLIQENLKPIHHAVIQVTVGDTALKDIYDMAQNSFENYEDPSEEQIENLLDQVCIRADVKYENQDLIEMLEDQSEMIKSVPLLQERITVTFQPQGQVQLAVGGACADVSSVIPAVLDSGLMIGIMENGILQQINGMFSDLEEMILEQAGDEEEAELTHMILDWIHNTNYVHAMKDQQAMGIAFRVLDSGYEVQNYAVYSDPKIAKMKSNALKGQSMAKPMYIGKNNIFVSAHDLSDNTVLHFERLTKLDPSFLIGQYLKMYDGIGGPVTIGIFATISTATFNGYFKKARDTERQSFIRNSQQIMIANQVSENVPDYRHGGRTSVEIKQIFDQVLAAQGYQVPEIKNEIGYYYFINSEDLADPEDVATDFIMFSCKEDALGERGRRISSVAFTAGTTDATEAITVDNANRACGKNPSVPRPNDGWTVLSLGSDLVSGINSQPVKKEEPRLSYFEEAQKTEAQTFVRNAQQIMIVSQVAEYIPDYSFGGKMSGMVVSEFNTQLANQGYSIPTDSSYNYYYALQTTSLLKDDPVEEFIIIACHPDHGIFFQAGTTVFSLEDKANLTDMCATNSALKLPGWMFIDLFGNNPVESGVQEVSLGSPNSPQSSSRYDSVPSSIERQPLEINILRPALNSEGVFETSESSFIIEGEVPSTVEYVTVNGYTLLKFKPGDTNFAYVANERFGTLSPGTNTFIIKVTDVFGKTAEKTITVNYAPGSGN